MNNYETVFILTPVLSDVQMKEAVEKFKKTSSRTKGLKL
jgi:small subunit ribosomal protein S6